jgi:uncharacterized protein (TIGR00297 family)
MDGRPHSEELRKLVHMTMSGFALLLRFLNWWQAALLAGSALAFNLVLLPRVAIQLYRPVERSKRFAPGILFYPLAVLLLILVFPARLDIAAAAWGILGIGDGMATIVGVHFGRRRIPWNREKSIAGTVALFLAGGAAGAFLAWWCRPAIVPAPSLWFSLGAPLVAAAVAALVETIPIRLDDNISVPAAAASVMWVLSHVHADRIALFLQSATYSVVPATAVNLLVAWIGYRAGTVNVSGAVAGTIIGVIVVVSGGWGAWALLLVTFLAAAISSRLCLRRKTLLGIAEERGGRRGAGNAIANTGVAAVATLMSALTEAREPALVAFAAALTAGGSDTVASEIGKAWGRRTYVVPTFRMVPPGTSGAMSLEGTAAGLASACLLGAFAIAVGLVPVAALIPIVIGATIGSLCESLLGATLEAPGIVNNDVLNFLNTAIAAVSAVVAMMIARIA